MFITSARIWHIAESVDPIFEARTAKHFEGWSTVYYYKSDPVARPLVCYDSTEFCAPSGHPCWTEFDAVPSDQDSPAYWLMKLSLGHSTIYDSIFWRLGTALLAQKNVHNFVSTPLSSDHWALEAEQLFQTSLARIQFDALGIASGEDQDLRHYVEVTPDEAKGNLCGLFKFNTANHKNVNFLAWLGLLSVALLMWILSLEVKHYGWCRYLIRKTWTATEIRPPSQTGHAQPHAQNGDAVAPAATHEAALPNPSDQRPEQPSIMEPPTNAPGSRSLPEVNAHNNTGDTQDPQDESQEDSADDISDYVLMLTLVLWLTCWSLRWTYQNVVRLMSTCKGRLYSLRHRKHSRGTATGDQINGVTAPA